MHTHTSKSHVEFHTFCASFVLTEGLIEFDECSL